MSGKQTSAVDMVVADAKDLPTLINSLQQVEPALAAALTSKALIASKSPWGTLAGGIVGWVVARYGLGWDEGTQTMVAGVGVLAGSYLMRYVTAGPISGLLTPKGKTP